MEAKIDVVILRIWTEKKHVSVDTNLHQWHCLLTFASLSLTSLSSSTSTLLSRIHDHESAHSNYVPICRCNFILLHSCTIHENTSPITCNTARKQPSWIYRSAALCGGIHCTVLPRRQCNCLQRNLQRYRCWVTTVWHNTHHLLQPDTNVTTLTFTVAVWCRRLELREVLVPPSDCFEIFDWDFFTGRMPSCHPTNNVIALKVRLLGQMYKYAKITH